MDYVAHETPVGRAERNYMIHASLLDGFSTPTREQLWTVQVTADTFEIACLPFFTRGVCFKDVVRLDSDHLLSDVVRKSGHRTLRVAVVRDHERRDELHELLHGQVVALALPHEWFQGTYLAVDLAPGFDERGLLEVLEEPASAGAVYWEIDT